MLGSNIVLLWDKKFCKITTKFGSILQRATQPFSASQFSISSTIAVNISLAGYFSRERSQKSPQYRVAKTVCKEVSRLFSSFLKF